MSENKETRERVRELVKQVLENVPVRGRTAGKFAESTLL